MSGQPGAGFVLHTPAHREGGVLTKDLMHLSWDSVAVKQSAHVVAGSGQVAEELTAKDVIRAHARDEVRTLPLHRIVVQLAVENPAPAVPCPAAGQRAQCRARQAAGQQPEGARPTRLQPGRAGACALLSAWSHHDAAVVPCSWASTWTT